MASAEGETRRTGVDAVRVATLNPEPPPAEYRATMALADADADADADAEADARLGEHMPLSWYDRDRDFESPQHASECHLDSAVPGYLDYALHRGAALKCGRRLLRVSVYAAGVRRGMSPGGGPC